MANVELVVTVTNFNYTEELQDPLSEAYKNFEKQFRQEVRPGSTRGSWAPRGKAGNLRGG